MSKVMLPLATSLAELAAKNPEAAEIVIGQIKGTVDMALRLGPLDPDVWARSFQATARKMANRAFAAKWTKAVVARFPGRRPRDTVKERNDKAR